MLFPLSEAFKKSQLSEFFDVSSGCDSLHYRYRSTQTMEVLYTFTKHGSVV